ncbi:MAG: hypothetical protein EP343_30640 [Deltaproteobacteria bacterium]|nr:MAG: hypothetical protein EP343_30640 [Deltaproteobacteria bacterium]
MRWLRWFLVLGLFWLALGCSPMTPPGGEGEGAEPVQEASVHCGEDGGSNCSPESAGAEEPSEPNSSEPKAEAVAEPSKEEVPSQEVTLDSGVEPGEEPSSPDDAEAVGPEQGDEDGGLDASEAAPPENLPGEEPAGTEQPPQPEVGPEKVLPPLPTKPYAITFGYGATIMFNRGLAVDDQGDVYVYGSFMGQASFGSTTLSTAPASFEIYLSKFSSDGTLLWVKKSQGKGFKEPNTIGLDPSGNVVITGHFYESIQWGSTTLDAKKGGGFVTKFSPSGTVQWSVQLGDSRAQMKALRTDAKGQIYVAGIFSGPASFGSLSFTGSASLDVFVVRLDAQGDAKWLVTGGGSSIDIPNDFCVSPQGDVYLLGQIFDTSVWGNTTLTTQQDDLFVVKWNAAGAIQWVVQSTGQGSTIPHALRWTPKGQLFLSTELEGKKTFGSFSIPSALHGTMTTILLDTSGKVIQSDYSQGSSHIHPTSVAFDSKGRIYVGGEFSGTFKIGNQTLTAGSKFHAYITRLSSQNKYDWSALSSGKGTAAGRWIAIDRQDNIYITGEFEDDVVMGGTTLKRQQNSFSKELFLWKLRAP